MSERLQRDIAGPDCGVQGMFRPGILLRRLLQAGVTSCLSRGNSSWRPLSLCIPLILAAGCAPRPQSPPLNGGPSLADSRQPVASEPQASGATALRFEDVAEQSGVEFTHTDGGSGRHFFVEQIGAGCALVDLNGDQYLDLFAVSGAPLPGYKGPPNPRHRLWQGGPL
jgi:hypothetical protein